MKEEIGRRIKNVREEMNMNKEHLAKLLGISGQYLGMVERGKCCLSVEKLKILCDITNLSADYILFGKDKNVRKNSKKMLSEFSDEQIINACTTLKDFALLIKNA